MNGQPVLHVEGVDKKFDDGPVLKGIDLSLAKDEVVAIIGPSGSGKSTLLRCINLIEPIESGRIFLEGKEITGRSIDQDEIRTRIGIVFQAFNLFPHMTVIDNITLGPRRVRRLDKAEAEKHAMGLLERFDLADKRNEYPDRLSGGQQQRTAIVRALAMEPRLLLLDEVTSALDPELVGEVLMLIRELAQGGMTMLIATHEMNFAREIAARVVFLDDGRIVEEGPPDVVFTSPQHPRTREFLQRIIQAGRL
jgi:polar amino acid transport system ATP-binding protein